MTRISLDGIVRSPCVRLALAVAALSIAGCQRRRPGVARAASTSGRVAGIPRAAGQPLGKSLACDGVTDDAPALFALVDQLIAAGTGQIVIPAGTCVLGQPIVRVLTGMQGLKLSGAGVGQTTLLFPHGGGLGFTLDLSSLEGLPLPTSLTIADLSLTTAGTTLTDRCVSVGITSAAYGSGAFVGASELIVAHVECSDSGGSAWLEGVHMTSVGAVDIGQFEYTGAMASGAPAGTGLVIENALAGEATQFNVKASRVSTAAFGVQATGHLQGLSVEGLTAQNVGTGVRWSTDYGEAQCSVTASSLSGDVGVALNQCAYATVGQNTITAQTSGVVLDGTSYVSMVGNTIRGAGAASDGIVLRASSAKNAITGNTISGVRYGIWLQPTTAGNVGSGNVVTGATAAAVHDEGSSNQVLAP